MLQKAERDTDYYRTLRLSPGLEAAQWGGVYEAESRSSADPVGAARVDWTDVWPLPAPAAPGNSVLNQPVDIGREEPGCPSGEPERGQLSLLNQRPDETGADREGRRNLCNGQDRSRQGTSSEGSLKRVEARAKLLQEASGNFLGEPVERGREVGRALGRLSERGHV